MIAPLLCAAVLCLAGEAGDREPVLGFVGLHGGAFERLEAAAPAAGVTLRYVEDDAIAAGGAPFHGLDAVVIQHVRDAKALALSLAAARAEDPELRVFALSGLRDLGAFAPEVVVENDPKLSAFYAAPRHENLEGLLLRLAALVTGGDDRSAEPLALEVGVLRHPARDEPFASGAELEEFMRQRGLDPETTPRVAVVAHVTHYLLQQPRVIAALVAEVERRGAFAFIAIDSEVAEYERLLPEARPDVAIHTCHATDRVEFREQVGIPHLHSAFFRGQSIAEWEESVQGLAPSEVVFHCATQELIGGIEPFATCGTLRGGGSEEDFTPIPDRIERIVGRALAHATLRRTPPSEKKLAIVYYDREASRASLMRGSPTGMFLNAPPSLLRALFALRDAGYQLEVPKDEDELIALAQRKGRVVGVSGPGEAIELAKTGEVPRVPLSLYRSWLDRNLSPRARAALEARWGEAPGTICVVPGEGGGEPSIVIPMIRLGNVVLLPQPLRGEAYDPSQTHERTTPPPHSYLAAYFWLRHEFGAAAVVHFGTHGSEFALPGKEVGPHRDDWTDIVFGELPNVAPWVMNNLGEAVLEKRRAFAVLVDHLVPPTTTAGLEPELESLHRDVDRFAQLDQGALRERLRETIGRKATEQRVDEDLSLDLRNGRPPTDDEIVAITDHLHEIEESLTPTSLHRLGVPPDDEARLPWLVHCGGEALIDALSTVHGIGPFDPEHGKETARGVALEILRRMLREGLSMADAIRAAGGRVEGEVDAALAAALDEAAQIDAGLEHTSDEITNLLAALDGKFVPPGPGNPPDRNPNAVPTGRNMYMLDPREIPTEESWAIGKQLADQLVARHLEEHGEYPRKVAFNLRASNTFRDYGVMEAQILWLVGCEPVRDKRGDVVDVSLVPREILGRPRIDVYVSGGSRYDDMLADRARLLDRAIRFAIDANEADNRVKQASEVRRGELIAAGVAAERAEVLARARIFGSAPGSTQSASYSYLVQRSGDWQDRGQLAEAWLETQGHAYTEGAWGEEAREAFVSALRDSQYVMRNWSDTTRGPTTDKYQWMHGGSLALAVEHVTGTAPRFVLSDLRDMDEVSLVDAEEALRRDFRVRALNAKWIRGMMQEGYAGADQLKVIASNAYGWETMRTDSVPDATFEKLADVYVRDSLDLGLREFFERENPWALQGIAETLLEAARKEMWAASDATVAELATLLVELREKHGEGGGLLTASNAALEAFVAEHAAPDDSATEAAAESTPQAAAAPAGAKLEPVEGVELAKAAAAEPRDESAVATDAPRGALYASLAALLLIAAGFVSRRGEAA
jgi:cobaltochelatase CobN